MSTLLEAGTLTPNPSRRRPWNSINSMSPTSSKRARRSSSAALHTRVSSSKAPEEVHEDLHTTPRARDQQETPELFQPASETSVPDFRLAIDFGTTNTSITFAKGHGKSDSILTIDNFPDQSDSKGMQVPTKSCYLTRKALRAGGNRSFTPSDPDPILSMKSARDWPSSAKYLYGYQVHEFLKHPEEHRDRRPYGFPSVISRMKLLLDASALGHESRMELKQTLQTLKKHGLVRKEHDVITHLLSSMFCHCKEYLQHFHGLDEHSTVEVTFSVPVCWSVKANAIMAQCVTTALEEAKLGMTNGSAASSLFMVNEAEAAATHTLNSPFHSLRRNEIFLLVDCGGGTTDLGMYRVSREHPLRLDTELCNPTGAWTGSSDLNARMRRLVLSDLQGEIYLEDPEPGLTIQNIVDSEIMPDFEDRHKRKFKLGNRKQEFGFRLRGLRASDTNPRLKPGCYTLSFDDMWKIFEPSFAVIRRLVIDQVDEARRRNIELDKIVLVGGFGDSPALQTFLWDAVKKLNEQHGSGSQFIHPPPHTGATGVAHGAILRAQDKRFGPERIPRRSYGILRHVEWNPDSDEDYMVTQKHKVEASVFDGLYEIRNTILWVLKANQGALQREHRVAFETIHCFPWNKTVWLAKEILYVSDTCTQDYYQLSHRKNKGKFAELGEVTFDLSALQGRIPLTSPTGGCGGMKHYEVHVRIEMAVIDRDLKFHVRWPPRSDGHIISGSQSSFNVVAAFEPGTA